MKKKKLEEIKNRLATIISVMRSNANHDMLPFCFHKELLAESEALKEIFYALNEECRRKTKSSKKEK